MNRSESGSRLRNRQPARNRAASTYSTKNPSPFIDKDLAPYKLIGVDESSAYAGLSQMFTGNKNKNVNIDLAPVKSPLSPVKIGRQLPIRWTYGPEKRFDHNKTSMFGGRTTPILEVILY